MPGENRLTDMKNSQSPRVGTHEDNHKEGTESDTKEGLEIACLSISEANSSLFPIKINCIAW